MGGTPGTGQRAGLVASGEKPLDRRPQPERHSQAVTGTGHPGGSARGWWVLSPRDGHSGQAGWTSDHGECRGERWHHADGSVRAESGGHTQLAAPSPPAPPRPPGAHQHLDPVRGFFQPQDRITPVCVPFPLRTPTFQGRGARWAGRQVLGNAGGDGWEVRGRLSYSARPGLVRAELLLPQSSPRRWARFVLASSGFMPRFGQRSPRRAPQRPQQPLPACAAAPAASRTLLAFRTWKTALRSGNVKIMMLARA